ncbi:MAG: hypothetical protein RLZZ09_3270 [Pseudomonadota bacterium]|jgi:hypothetical protein
MTALSIQPTFPIFTDIDGQPLEDGYVWIGTANLPPITNPITVYWDAALTLPATQPIRTRGGYPINSGTPARLYVNSDYSIQVQNKNGSLIYSAPAAGDRFSDVVIAGIDSSDVTFIQAGTGAVTRTAQAKMRDVVSVKDFGAVGDGSTNDSPVLSAIATWPAGFPAGTYQINSDVAGLGKQFYGFGNVKFSGAGKVQTPTAYGIGALANNVGFNTSAPSLTDKNTAFGTRALYNNTTGYHNTAVGDEALFTNITGNQNTAIGMNALYNNTGENNTAVGVSALLANTTGINNTAVGRAAGISLVAANYNTLAGRNCGWQKTNGDNDTYFGAEIAWNATTSTGDNAAFGWRAAYSLSGQYNVAIGNESLYSATSANSCVVVGRRAAFTNTASEITAVGYQASFSNTSALRVTSLGARAGYTNTTSADGTYIGWQAGYGMTGNNAVAIGSGSGAGSGNNNTIIGTNAANGLTTGGQNVVIGTSVAQNLQNGSQNTIIGYGATAPAAGVNNQLVLVAGTTKLQLTGGLQWLNGAGSPETVITAPVGSLYTRIDGGAGTTLYVKESGSGNTGWVAK